MRRFGWSLFLLGSPLGNTTAGLLFLFVASVFARLWRGETVASEPARSEPQRDASRNPFFIAAYAFLGAAIVSAVGSRRPDIALLTALAFLLILILILRGSAQLIGEHALVAPGKFIPWMLVIGAVGTAGAVAFDLSRGLPRVEGWLGPNGLGGLCAFFAVIAIAYAVDARPSSLRLVGALSCPVYLIGLALSASRGSWLGFLASAGVWTALFTIKHAERRRFVASAVAGVLALALIVLAVYPPILEHLLRMASLERNMDRIYIWSAAVRMIADDPLTGVGGGNFPFAYSEYRSEGDPMESFAFAHNLFLHVMAEYGLLGLVPFAVMIAIAVRRGWAVARSGSPLLQATYAGYIGFLVHDMFDNITHGMNIGGLFWLLTGLLVHLRRERSHCTGLHEPAGDLLVGSGRGEEGRREGDFPAQSERSRGSDHILLGDGGRETSGTARPRCALTNSK